MTTRFSVQGASLKLLRSHERGVITRINTLCDTTAQKLRALGLTPGQSITVEQRFPRFIIRVGNDRHALDETAINAIYVRIVEH
ncbi:MAG: ferrous iron transport protein A [Cyanobacteria bacterium CRU_2_1]|nr:ferrous iron transport protein A [Cyanobacteria bacterium CRU_2_1]